MSTPDRSLRQPDAHPCIYLLADHLDALLAAGEDIRALSLDGAKPMASGIAQTSALRDLTERARALELVIVARALQARDRCREVRSFDPRLRPMIDLFIGGTAILADAVEEYGDATFADFQSGDDLVVYLRQRGALDAAISDTAGGRALRIGPGFRIVGRIELGALMDMCASFLDLIETHYELYGDTAAAPASAAA